MQSHTVNINAFSPVVPITQPTRRRNRHFRNDWQGVKPRIYFQRWIQLAYLSMLALLSDWVCFSLAAAPEAFEEYYEGHSSSNLIDIFLFTNVASSFLVTDIVARYGMQRTMQFAAALMSSGCWLRSGFGLLFDSPETTTLVPFSCVVFGTILVGAAQPFFQCTPPLLSAQWFASDERATSTAIALNFNQIGIATAFLVGGCMATSVEGLQKYNALIAIFSTVLMIGTFWQFQELPSFPPSTSELEKLMDGKKEPPFFVSVRTFFTTPGFTRPLIAFICSIAVTNIVGAFIDNIMARGGITKKFHVALVGAAFEIAIVIGGIVIGGYVDRTKKYKRITLIALVVSIIFLMPLGFTNHAIGKSPILLIMGLVGLGFTVGPIQPINAELAVDVTYPGDETAVESVQQIGGNLVSALLVPLAERASRADYNILPNVSILASDIRGDVVLLMILTVLTFFYYRGFNAPLRRTIADRNDDEVREQGVEMSQVHNEDHEMGKLLLDNEVQPRMQARACHDTPHLRVV